MTFPITSIYAGLLGLMLLALAIIVVRGRIRHKIPFGDAGNAEFARWVRAHANFAEHVPTMLVLLALVEAQGWPALTLHILGAGTVAARALHAYGVGHQSKAPPNFGRQYGVLLTWGVLATLSAMCLAGAILPG